MLPFRCFLFISICEGALAAREYAPFAVESALSGYDIFKGKPFSGISNFARGSSIFEYSHNVTQITTLNNCTPQMQETVMTSMEEYRNHQKEAFILGTDYWEIDPEIKEFLAPEIANLTFNESVLGPFETYHYSEQSIKELFEENGALVELKFVCPVYNVRLNKQNVPDFPKNFENGVKTVARRKREHEFRRFIENFGTHFSTETVFGKALVYTRKFSSSETNGLSNSELVHCAKKQTRYPIFANRNTTVSCVEPFYVNEGMSTYGSFFVDSIDDWLSRDNDTPYALQNRFTPIVNLFSRRNLRKIGRKIRARDLVRWFYPLYLNVTTVMGYSADRQGW